MPDLPKTIARTEASPALAFERPIFELERKIQELKSIPDVSLNGELKPLEKKRDKLIDAMTPGYQAEFDPEEAERAGAFVEDALSEADALASVVDATVPVERQEG